MVCLVEGSANIIANISTQLVRHYRLSLTPGERAAGAPIVRANDIIAIICFSELNYQHVSSLTF